MVTRPRAGLKTAAACALLGTALGVLGPVVPAEAHSGYHHGGVTGTYQDQRYGIQAILQVTNPDVPVDTGDHYVSTMHVSQNGYPPGATCAGDRSWLEIGWAEVGWKKDTAGNPLRAIFTFHTNNCKWIFHEKYTLNVGDRVLVRIVPKPDCQPTIPCEWRLMIRWGGQWRVLRTPKMPFDNSARINVTPEPQNKESGSHWNPAGAATNNYVNVYQVRFRRADGTWAFWTAGGLSTCRLDELPYVTEFYNNADAVWRRFEQQEFHRIRYSNDSSFSTSSEGCVS